MICPGCGSILPPHGEPCRVCYPPAVVLGEVAPGVFPRVGAELARYLEPPMQLLTIPAPVHAAPEWRPADLGRWRRWHRRMVLDLGDYLDAAGYPGAEVWVEREARGDGRGQDVAVQGDVPADVLARWEASRFRVPTAADVAEKIGDVAGRIGDVAAGLERWAGLVPGAGPILATILRIVGLGSDAVEAGADVAQGLADGLGPDDLAAAVEAVAAAQALLDEIRALRE